MYYAESTHPAIISKEEFDSVQALLHRRAKREISKSHDSPFDQKYFVGNAELHFEKKSVTEKCSGAVESIARIYKVVP